jgi:hypothetical protein
MNFLTALPGDQSLDNLGGLSIYAGILGQIGDIIMFTATARRLKEIFPRSQLTFAVSRRYREAGELIEGLAYVDRVFVTECYFERLTPALQPCWDRGWPVDLRGDDEVAEQRGYDLVLETRPRHACECWWQWRHQVEEAAYSVGVPGPIDLRTEICIPQGTRCPVEASGKIVLHNDPAVSQRKAWPWVQVRDLVRRVGAEAVVLLGNPGPEIAGTLDLRGKTTLSEAAAIISQCRCYVGIDSGLMWIAGSLQVPSIGIYGTTYAPAYGSIQPFNPRAVYLQAEGPPSLISADDVYRCFGQVTGTVPP